MSSAVDADRTAEYLQNLSDSRRVRATDLLKEVVQRGLTRSPVDMELLDPIWQAITLLEAEK